MSRIAFATSKKLKDRTDDDRLAVAPLKARGIEVVPAIWNDPKVAWGSFDLVVVRSPWDYMHHGDAFREWFTTLDRSGCRSRTRPRCSAGTSTRSTSSGSRSGVVRWSPPNGWRRGG